MTTKNLRARTWGGDTGAVSIEALLFPFGLAFISVVLTLLLNLVLPDGFLPVASPWVALIIFVVLLVVIPCGSALEDHMEGRAIEKTRAEDGAKLVRWLGLTDESELHDHDASQWRSAKKRGLTEDVADQWAAAGYSFQLADSARRTGMSLDQVHGIAEVLRTNGLWDGNDRRSLANMISGTHYLTTWGTFAPEDVHRVAVALRARQAEELAKDPTAMPVPVREFDVYRVLTSS